MQHPCRLITSATTPIITFDAVAFLADHVLKARGERAIALYAGRYRVAEDAPQTPCVLILYADEAGGPLGVAVVGEPALPEETQKGLLKGALWRLREGAEQALAKHPGLAA